MPRKYTTSRGIKKRTNTYRRYIVVSADSGTIFYRTDVADRAYRFAAKQRQKLGIAMEVIDLDTGTPATRPPWRN